MFPSSTSPSLSRSDAVEASRSASRSHSETVAPDASNRSAMARPIPWAPPVTTARLPARSIRFTFIGFRPIQPRVAQRYCETSVSEATASIEVRASGTELTTDYGPLTTALPDRAHDAAVRTHGRAVEARRERTADERDDARDLL